jgi:hypothetical protein
MGGFIDYHKEVYPMIIHIKEPALDYLKAKQETSIHLKLNQSNTCCSSRMIPEVELGKPDDPQNYTREEISGINVYVRHGIKALHDTLTISLTNLLLIKTLTVEGVAEENIYT